MWLNFLTCHLKMFNVVTMLSSPRQLVSVHVALKLRVGKLQLFSLNAAQTNVESPRVYVLILESVQAFTPEEQRQSFCSQGPRTNQSVHYGLYCLLVPPFQLGGPGSAAQNSDASVLWNLITWVSWACYWIEGLPTPNGASPTFQPLALKPLFNRVFVPREAWSFIKHEMTDRPRQSMPSCNCCVCWSEGNC